MNIPQNLIDEFGKGNGVLFIGAGLSKGAGLPDWNALVQPLAKEIDCTETDLLKIAQYYCNARGKHTLIQKIKRALSVPGIAPTANHARVARLPARAIFTTNFDALLERALDHAARAHHRIVLDKGIPYWSEDELQLVKMHGSLDDEETLVITQDDYDDYFSAHPSIATQFAALLLTRTFLFIGYSLSDPDFWHIYNHIRRGLGEHKRPAYAILLNCDAHQIEDLKRKNLYALNLTVPAGGDYNTTLGEFLEIFLKQLPVPTPKIAVTPAPPTPVELLADRVTRLLEATGSKLLHRQSQDARQILLTVCVGSGGARESKWLVACGEGEIEAADVRASEHARAEMGAERAYLVSERSVPHAARRAAEQSGERVYALTLDAFYRVLANFTVYAQYLIGEWEKGDLARYYIDLGGKRPHFENGQKVGEDTHKPLDDYLDAWLNDSGRNHISILGDYGTGKTTLVRQYAAKLARKYLAHPEKSRIPILIPLRDYNKAMNLRQLVTDFLVNEQAARVKLDGGNAAFEQLNRDGKFVLIFDGFDEMTRQVTSQTTVDNFEELAQAATDQAKVILTCRTHYFREAREERRLFNREEMFDVISSEREKSPREGKPDPAIDLRKHPGFQIVYLDEFTPDDVTELLRRRFPEDWQTKRQQIHATYNLEDLARRPVWLDMIVQALPDWGKQNIRNVAELYQHCTEKWLDHEFRTGERFTDQERKRIFTQELATEVFRSEQFTGIHYSKFPDLVKKQFNLDETNERDLLAREFQAHSFLIRDADGLYKFSHKSFIEFFVAQKLWRALNAGQTVIASPEGVKQSPRNLGIASSQTALLAMTLPFKISEEIRAFIYGLFERGLPAFAAPRNIPAGMVYVPPGPFVMGGEVYDDEKPTRIAVLQNGFFIDRFPVTHAQYKKFVNATKHRVPFVDADWARPYNWDRKARTFPAGLENHPVVLVSWNDASAYAKWAGKRLPAEIEWEKAARGIDGRAYPWGDSWDRKKCNTASYWLDEDVRTSEEWEEKFKPRWEIEWIGKKIMTTPVGQFQNGASPYGCGDMVGNVWEWCADWYDDQKTTRVLRGGAWSGCSNDTRAAARGNVDPAGFRVYIGFRCARSP